MPYPDLSYLRSQVQGELLEYSALLFPAAMIDRAINDGQLDVALKTLCIEGKHTYSTVASSQVISMSSRILTTDDDLPLITDEGVVLVTGDEATIIKVLGVEYVPLNGTVKALLPITPLQIGHTPVRDVVPEFFFRWGEYVGLEPKPSTTLYTLNIYVALSPTAKMISDGDIPEVPEGFVDLIHPYAVARCLMRMRKFQSAFNLYNKYRDECQKRRMAITNKYANKAEDILIPDRLVAQ